MNTDRDTMKANSHDALAYSQAHATYGVARPVDIAPVRASADITFDLAARLKFMVSEITGIWFVVFTSLIILGVPAAVLSAGRVALVMYRVLKRLIDIVGALVGLVLALPLLIVVPILIKLDSPGPVFYRQTRVGIDRRKKDRRYCQKTGIARDKRSRDRRREDYYGELFKVIKFRTMVHEAEKQSGPVWATKGDSRVTRLGQFLRKSRIDEIPQFINVLKGDMALVGPRPERPHFVEKLAEEVEGYTERLAVKPGLTGLAQVESGYDSSIATVARKVRLDQKYIQEMSLTTDVKILLKTVKVVLTGKGAC